MIPPGVIGASTTWSSPAVTGTVKVTYVNGFSTKVDCEVSVSARSHKSASPNGLRRAEAAAGAARWAISIDSTGMDNGIRIFWRNWSRNTLRRLIYRLKTVTAMAESRRLTATWSSGIKDLKNILVTF